MPIVMRVSSRNRAKTQTVPTATSGQVDRRRGEPLRVGFWATNSRFSQVALATLLDHHEVAVVALPAGEGQPTPVVQWLPPAPVVDELVIVNSGVAAPIVQAAWQQTIPVYGVQRLRSPIVAAWLGALALDLVCVACFPWRIPAALLALPTYGFLNIHPSLLPYYRGPAPLFWQLRAGLASGGVTVHWMDATLDTGPIAAQSSIPFPAGATSAELDRRLAGSGAHLLVDVIGQLERGGCPHQLQPTTGSQQSWPTAADFRLDRQWSARHAYNFMCGTDEWRQPYPVTVAGEELLLRQALTYVPDEQLGQPILRRGAEVAIQFAPGVLYAHC